MLIVTYITFLINPLFSSVFIIIGFLRDRKNNVHYSGLFAGVLASLAYWVIPKGEMDLTRYFDIVTMYGNMNWDYFLKNIMSGDLLFLQNLLFYIIGKTGNPHLLPAIVIFISYFIMFYMLTDYANVKKAKSSEVLIALLFLLCVMPFISLVSNIRNILAFSILTLGIYREFIQGKKNIITILFYVIPCFIHISSLSLLLLRFLAGSSSKRKGINGIVFVAGIILIILLFNNAELVSSLPLVGDYLGEMLTKANVYLFDTSSEYAQALQNDTFSKFQKLYFVLSVIYLLVLVYRLPVENSKHKFETYLKYVAFTVIASYPIVLTVYFRYTMAVLMLAFICILIRIRKIRLKEWKLLTYAGLLIVMIIGLLQQLYFFNSLAYIDQMVVNMGTRSIFNMFIQ